MSNSFSGRLLAPSADERAKTLAAHHGPAVLVPGAQYPMAHPAESASRIVPVFHHVHGTGSVSLLLPSEHPLVAATTSITTGSLGATLELADEAAVSLKEPIRGLLWISGQLRALSETTARHYAIAIAQARPDVRLLDLGHGLSLLRLTPGSLVLADSEGTHSLRPHQFSAATVDPFQAQEREWLRHLESSHDDVLNQLGRHVPQRLRNGRIRPLSVDRYGLRLRIEHPQGDHDVRLAFSRTITDAAQLAMEMQRLITCPRLLERHS